jgi:hypothetical protein
MKKIVFYGKGVLKNPQTPKYVNFEIKKKFFKE